MSYTEDEKKYLLKLARDSIEYGVQHHDLMSVELSQYPESFQLKGASFVTLHLKGHLRGCIGSLQAYQPLVVDVVSNAFNAAFQDPRFSPVTKDEASLLDIHISVLSEPEPMTFTSEDDFISQMRPGVDGYILSAGGNRGTFLPSVWEELPDPVIFLRHLKMKAGLSQDYWSDDVKIERYVVESIKSTS